jgi:integrase
LTALYGSIDEFSRRRGVERHFDAGRLVGAGARDELGRFESCLAVGDDLRDLSLEARRIHGLRHSSATMMISSGLSPKVVSLRLGHATVAITLDTCSHVLPAHDQAAADFQSLDGAAQALPRDSLTNL